jgi:hypothetical protein
MYAVFYSSKLHLSALVGKEHIFYLSDRGPATSYCQAGRVSFTLFFKLQDWSSIVSLLPQGVMQHGNLKIQCMEKRSVEEHISCLPVEVIIEEICVQQCLNESCYPSCSSNRIRKHYISFLIGNS